MKRVYNNGDVTYRNSNGELHRTDDPAIEYANGDRQWYINGYRVARMFGGHVVIFTKGELITLMKQSIIDNRVEYRNSNGQLHRIDATACEWDDGAKWWYNNGQLHRTDGPAIEWVDGDRDWVINGRLLAHMIDGKVYIYTEGKLPPLIKQSIAMEALKV